MDVASIPTSDLLERAAIEWSRNQYVCDRPSYGGCPEARYLAEVLSSRIVEVESRLREFTRSPNQWLVAHALLCFDLARNQGFMTEYQNLCDDSRHVSVSYHSFGHRLSLGAIVRRLKKKYAASAEPPTGLAFAIPRRV